jgi:hypothetical protein
MSSLIRRMRLVAFGAAALAAIGVAAADPPDSSDKPVPAPSADQKADVVIPKETPVRSTESFTVRTPAKLPYGVEDVLKLTKAQVSEDIIINFIHNSGTVYALGAQEIVYLKQEGVTDRVLNAMLEQHKRVGDVAAAQAAAAQAAASQAAAQAAAQAAQAQSYADAQNYNNYNSGSSTYVIPYSDSYYGYYQPYGYYSPYYSYSYSFPFLPPGRPRPPGGPGGPIGGPGHGMGGGPGIGGGGPGMGGGPGHGMGGPGMGGGGPSHGPGGPGMSGGHPGGGPGMSGGPSGGPGRGPSGGGGGGRPPGGGGGGPSGGPSGGGGGRPGR